MEALRWSASQLPEGISRRLETKGSVLRSVCTEQSGLRAAAGLLQADSASKRREIAPFFSLWCRLLGAGTSPRGRVSPSPTRGASSVAGATSQLLPPPLLHPGSLCGEDPERNPSFGNFPVQPILVAKEMYVESSPGCLSFR